MSGVVGEPLPATLAQRKWWRERMASLDFDPEVNFVAPSRSRANPPVAIRARLAILLATYRDDYHTDSFDLDRLCGRVERAEEEIVFWGSPDSVDRLLAWLTSESGTPSDRELAGLELGTATLIDAGEEFGAGHRELCRGGSVCRAVSSVGATISSLLRFFTTQEPSAGFHTIVSVVRNRPSRPGIAGGAAIHRLYTREIRSSFWGFAPWYVMQGGLLELLDYREVYRDNDTVGSAVAGSPAIQLSDPEEGALVGDLLELNLGPERPRPGIEIEAPGRQATGGWQLAGDGAGDLIGFNHLTLHPSATAGRPLDELLGTQPARAAACAVARLPLTARHRGDHAVLRAHGFRLSAVSPPKALTPNASFTGFWSRPRDDLELAEPYYFDSRLLEPVEARIVGHFRKAVAEWKHSDFAAAL